MLSLGSDRLKISEQRQKHQTAPDLSSFLNIFFHTILLLCNVCYSVVDYSELSSYFLHLIISEEL